MEHARAEAKTELQAARAELATVRAEANAALSAAKEAHDRAMSDARATTHVNLTVIASSMREVERDAREARLKLNTAQAQLNQLVPLARSLQSEVDELRRQLSDEARAAERERMRAENEQLALAVQKALERAADWQDEARRMRRKVGDAEARITAAFRCEAQRACDMAAAAASTGRSARAHGSAELLTSFQVRPDQVAPRELIEGVSELAERLDEGQQALHHASVQLDATSAELARVTTAAEEQRVALVKAAVRGTSCS